MCGVVGYLGAKDVVSVLVHGLEQLEYRGYDSAGIALLNENSIMRVRAKGKLINLKEKIETCNIPPSSQGIAHTRWATHGVPSQENAHPHRSGRITIVHNGIIENFGEIKQKLLLKERNIESDTDSELVAHLLDIEVEKGLSLVDAVFNVSKSLEGAYSILAMDKNQPDSIVAFKNGPPLVVGIGDGENYIASDIQAIVNYTRKIIYPKDHDVLEVKSNEIIYWNKNKEKQNPKIVEIDWSREVADKKGYEYFMLKEIFEQPQTIAQSISSHINIEAKSLQLSLADESMNAQFQTLLEKIDNVNIIACGSSYYAAMYGKYVIERFCRKSVEIDIASEFRYRNPVMRKNTLGLVISQSGETADTLSALRLFNKNKIPTLSICNVKGSTIDREATYNILMNSGVEKGVASTKAFTSTMVLLQVFALSWAKSFGKISKRDEQSFVEELLSLPSKMEKVLVYNSYFKDTAHLLTKVKGFLYLGRGFSYPIALEGALKLKELAYLHAEGYAAGEMKHGPLALIDEEMLVVAIAPSDEVFEKTMSNLSEARARGAKVISLGTDDNKQLVDSSEFYLNIPKSNLANNPILCTIPLQLLSLHVAKALNHDVDQPRNLAKSVTVE